MSARRIRSASTSRADSRGGRVGRRPVHGDPVAPGFLGFVHREVGGRQHLDGREAVEQRDPDAGGDGDRLLAEHRDLAAERLDDAVGDDLRLIGIRLGRSMANSSPPTRARTSVSRMRPRARRRRS